MAQQESGSVDSRLDRIERAIEKLASDVTGALVATEQRLTDALAAAEEGILERTQEMVRDAQTELLRGFVAYSERENIQLRKLRADVSNVDASTEERMAILERRLFEIEKRLFIIPPPPPPQ